MSCSSKTLISLLIGGLLLSAAPAGFAQKPAPRAAPMPAPAPVPAPAPQTSPQPRVVVVEPIRVFDPFFAYPYPYAYPPDYMAQNFGYVKLKAESKDAKNSAVYIDGGFADKLAKAKEFALRPGNHNIELRDSDGRTLLRQRVAITLGKTTELQVG